MVEAEVAGEGKEDERGTAEKPKRVRFAWT
jgi:hypothetical protein